VRTLREGSELFLDEEHIFLRIVFMELSHFPPLELSLPLLFCVGEGVPCSLRCCSKTLRFS
jgi:hypothetical protein